MDPRRSRTFARGRLSLLTARREGELVGALPFVQRLGVLSAPANWHTPVFGYLADDRAVSDALVEQLISRAAVRTDLAPIDADHPWLASCRAAAGSAAFNAIERTITRSPYVDLTGGDWDSYRASLSRKRRQEIDRNRRRLSERGQVALDIQDGRSDLTSLLAAGLALEGSGWKDQRGTAILSDPKTHQFYAEVSRWAAERGWLRMTFLRLDGRAIAYLSSLVCQVSPGVLAPWTPCLIWVRGRRWWWPVT